MDAYRDPTGELSLFIITCKIVHHRSRRKYFALHISVLSLVFILTISADDSYWMIVHIFFSFLFFNDT